MALFNKAGLATGVSGVGLQMSRRLPPFKMSRQVTRTHFFSCWGAETGVIQGFNGMQLKIGMDLQMKLDAISILTYHSFYNLFSFIVPTLFATCVPLLTIMSA